MLSAPKSLLSIHDDGVFHFNTPFFQLFKVKVKANKVLFYGQTGRCFLFTSLFFSFSSYINLRVDKAIEMGQKMDIFTFAFCLRLGPCSFKGAQSGQMKPKEIKHNYQ